LSQASRQLELNAEIGGKGVRFAVSNDAAQRHFEELFMKNFPDEMKDGLLSVWSVSGSGM